MQAAWISTRNEPVDNMGVGICADRIAAIDASFLHEQDLQSCHYIRIYIWLATAMAAFHGASNDRLIGDAFKKVSEDFGGRAIRHGS